MNLMIYKTKSNYLVVFFFKFFYIYFLNFFYEGIHRVETFKCTCDYNIYESPSQLPGKENPCL